MCEFVVLLDVGFAAHDAAWHRPLVDSEFQDHPDMERGECEQGSRNNEDVEREESRECCPVNDGPAQHEVDKLATNQRNTTHDRSADAQAPVGVLIKTKHLAGEGHAEGHEEHEYSQNPCELAGEFVCAEEKDLSHMDQDDCDHEVG